MSNCVIFALAKWFRHGGYIIARKSRYGWWPHVMWAATLDGVEVQHYLPDDPKHGMWIPPPVFRGRIVVGEDK